MNPGTELIQAAGLARDYGQGTARIQALRGVDLRVARGELVAVTGASGSGKSTLLHLLGLLDRPTAGSYWLNGQSVVGLSPGARAHLRNHWLGFVFQGFHLLPRNTARDNVALPLLYGGIRRSERRRRADEALTAMGLAERACHLPNELSGGEKQRVAIARALVNNPAVLLADEPTGALDSRTGKEILALLQTLNAQGMTVVIVTHDQEVAGMARRTITLADGRLVSDKVQ